MGDIDKTLNISNDMATINELVASAMPLIGYFTKKYRLNDNPEKDDIISDARMVMVKRAQIFDKKRNDNFQTFCFPWVRKQILESISSCQSIKYGNNVHNTNIIRSLSNKRKQPMLIHGISIDAPVNNEDNTNANDNTLLDILGQCDPNVYGSKYPNHINDCLTEIEFKLVKLLWMTHKERKSHGLKQWDDEVLALINEYKVVLGFPIPFKRLFSNKVAYYKYRIAHKIWCHYRKLGYNNIEEPSKKWDWRIKD